MENKEELEIELFCSPNEYDIKQVCSILEENNIPFVRRDDGSGAYMNLYMGQSIQEKRIFISKKDYEKSLEMITPFSSNNEDEEINEEDEKEKSKYNSIKFIFGLFMIGMPIIAILIAIIAIF